MASADAAAIAAAHSVLKHYFPDSGAALDLARANYLAAIAPGPAKNNGVATGEAAALAMIAARENDGSAPPQFSLPVSGAGGAEVLRRIYGAAGHAISLSTPAIRE